MTKNKVYRVVVEGVANEITAGMKAELYVSYKDAEATSGKLVVPESDTVANGFVSSLTAPYVSRAATPKVTFQLQAAGVPNKANVKVYALETAITIANPSEIATTSNLIDPTPDAVDGTSNFDIDISSRFTGLGKVVFVYATYEDKDGKVLFSDSLYVKKGGAKATTLQFGFTDAYGFSKTTGTAAAPAVVKEENTTVTLQVTATSGATADSIAVSYRKYDAKSDTGAYTLIGMVKPTDVANVGTIDFTIPASLYGEVIELKAETKYGSNDTETVRLSNPPEAADANRLNGYLQKNYSTLTKVEFTNDYVLNTPATGDVPTVVGEASSKTVFLNKEDAVANFKAPKAVPETGYAPGIALTKVVNYIVGTWSGTTATFVPGANNENVKTATVNSDGTYSIALADGEIAKVWSVVTAGVGNTVSSTDAVYVMRTALLRSNTVALKAPTYLKGNAQTSATATGTGLSNTDAFLVATDAYAPTDEVALNFAAPVFTSAIVNKADPAATIKLYYKQGKYGEALVKGDPLAEAQIKSDGTFVVTLNKGDADKKLGRIDVEAYLTSSTKPAAEATYYVQLASDTDADKAPSKLEMVLENASQDSGKGAGTHDDPYILLEAKAIGTATAADRAGVSFNGVAADSYQKSRVLLTYTAEGGVAKTIPSAEAEFFRFTVPVEDQGKLIKLSAVYLDDMTGELKDEFYVKRAYIDPTVAPTVKHGEVAADMVTTNETFAKAYDLTAATEKATDLTIDFTIANEPDAKLDDAKVFVNELKVTGAMTVEEFKKAASTPVTVSPAKKDGEVVYNSFTFPYGNIAQGETKAFYVRYATKNANGTEKPVVDTEKLIFVARKDKAPVAANIQMRIDAASVKPGTAGDGTTTPVQLAGPTPRFTISLKNPTPGMTLDGCEIMVSESTTFNQTNMAAVLTGVAPKIVNGAFTFTIGTAGVGKNLYVGVVEKGETTAIATMMINLEAGKLTSVDLANPINTDPSNTNAGVYSDKPVLVKVEEDDSFAYFAVPTYVAEGALKGKVEFTVKYMDNDSVNSDATDGTDATMEVAADGTTVYKVPLGANYVHVKVKANVAGDTEAVYDSLYIKKVSASVTTVALALPSANIVSGAGTQSDPYMVNSKSLKVTVNPTPADVALADDSVVVTNTATTTETVSATRTAKTNDWTFELKTAETYKVASVVNGVEKAAIYVKVKDATANPTGLTVAPSEKLARGDGKDFSTAYLMNTASVKVDAALAANGLLGSAWDGTVTVDYAVVEKTIRPTDTVTWTTGTTITRNPGTNTWTSNTVDVDAGKTVAFKVTAKNASANYEDSAIVYVTRPAAVTSYKFELTTVPAVSNPTDHNGSANNKEVFIDNSAAEIKFQLTLTGSQFDLFKDAAMVTDASGTPFASDDSATDVSGPDASGVVTLKIGEKDWDKAIGVKVELNTDMGTANAQTIFVKKLASNKVTAIDGLKFRDGASTEITDVTGAGTEASPYVLPNANAAFQVYTPKLNGGKDSMALALGAGETFYSKMLIERVAQKNNGVLSYVKVLEKTGLVETGTNYYPNSADAAANANSDTETAKLEAYAGMMYKVTVTYGTRTAYATTNDISEVTRTFYVTSAADASTPALVPANNTEGDGSSATPYKVPAGMVKVDAATYKWLRENLDAQITVTRAGVAMADCTAESLFRTGLQLNANDTLYIKVVVAGADGIVGTLDDTVVEAYVKATA